MKQGFFVERNLYIYIYIGPRLKRFTCTQILMKICLVFTIIAVMVKNYDDDNVFDDVECVWFLPALCLWSGWRGHRQTHLIQGGSLRSKI